MEVLQELVLIFAQSLLGGLMLNGGSVVLVYFVLYKWILSRFPSRRIQKRVRADDRQLRRELKNAFFTFLIGSSTATVLYYCASKGYTELYTDFSRYPIWSSLSFFALLFINDTWFYWIHRLLHYPKLFKFIHLEHHKSVDVNPFTSLSFHVAESFLLTLWFVPFSFLCPMYAPMLMLVQLYGLFENVKAHLGYELYPNWWNRSIFRFLNSSTHHNMHHSKFSGNYGLHFRFWDKLMNTEFKDYEATFEEVSSKKQKRTELK